MKQSSVISLLLMLFFTSTQVYSQDEYDEKIDSVRFVFGLNFGAHFANSNTASLYTGSPNVSPFGIDYIFNRPFNQQVFDQFFNNPYEIAEYPFNPKYRAASEIGFHTAYKFGPDWSNTIYLDFNIAQVKFEQNFTVAIYDPQNQIPGPTYQQFPIFGRENRFHLNLGTQWSLYHDEGSNAYFSLFGNLNNVQMRRNYIVIDDREYEIFHRNVDRPSERLGGVGYGGGGGLGFKFSLTEDIIADFYYNLYYTQINFKEEFKPYGVQHSLGIRFIWGSLLL